jgi:hypothetical protein
MSPTGRDAKRNCRFIPVFIALFLSSPIPKYLHSLTSFFSKTVAQHSEVQPPSGKELGMGAVLDDLALLHHKNQIAVYGGFESVRDQDDGSVAP